MERLVQKFHSHREAEEADKLLYRSMTAVERIKIARELQTRVYGKHRPDIRACHRKK